MFKNATLIAGAVVASIVKGKFKWFLVKASENSDWEIPKVAVRKAESSVRATLRMIGEQAGMSARVLEEAGRYSTNVVGNGKTINQKIFYYLLLKRADSGESVGFFESGWFEYSKAYKKLSLKREKESLSNANKILKEWWKKRKKK